MFYVLLIIFLSFHFSISNNPILIASPYPFNTSKSSCIECFSNDQGIILSLTITATMLDIDKNNPSLQYTQNNITKNESIILTIPAPFNYSQLYSKIECRSKYHHGVQKISQLDVLSVVEIPEKQLFSMNTNTKQMVSINCLTYGTNVFIHWNFSKDISKDIFGPLPIGIRIYHEFIINDTLIIDHVSYSDHHGYYQCFATNKLLGLIYEDKSVIYLNVKKNIIWIPIVIVGVIIGICILILILCSKYCQRKRKNQLEEKDILQEDKEMIDKIKQIVPNQESTEFSSYYNRQRSSEQMVENVEQSKIQQENIHILPHSKNSIKTTASLLSTEKEEQQISYLYLSSISKMSPQFVLSNPFLDPNVQPITSIKQYLNKLK